MKALVVHVPYQVRGGEDVAVESQKKALEALGYEVSLWPNDRTPPKLDPIRILASLNGSDQWKELENEFARERPKFAILNNIYPIYGPRLLRFLNQKKIPLFFAIHNHRLYCTNGLAMRDGSVCKLCKNSSPFRSVAFNCNQNYMRSIYYATALSQIRRDRLLGSLQAFVAPSPYIGEEIKSLGIPMEKIHWIVNPVLDVSGGLDGSTSGAPGFDVFFGSRLSPEKGIKTFLTAIENLPQLKFAMAGDGELKGAVLDAAQRLPNLTYLGVLSRSDVLARVKKCKITVLPSQCNEALPTSVIEAFVCGKRCVIPDMESTRWLADKPFPGVLANTFDAVQLASAILKAAEMSPIPTEQINEMKAFFGFDRYRINLGNLIEKTLAKPSGLR